MSIIYDALKKVEKYNQRLPQAETPPLIVKEKKHFRPQVYFLYALIVVLGLVIGNVFFSFLATSGNPPLPQKITPLAGVAPQIPPSPAPSPSSLSSPPSSPLRRHPTAINIELQESLVLNGVFFSQDEGYALINNQIVKEGDIISGATVKRIDLDKVELEAGGLEIELSTKY